MTRNTVEDGVGDFCFVLRNLIGTEQSNRRREHIRFKGSFNLKKIETEEKKMRLTQKYAINEKSTIFNKLL